MVRFGAHHVGGVSTWGATHLVASNSHLCAEQAKGRQAVTASELIQAPKKQTRGRSERKGGAQVCDLSLRTNPRVSTGSCTHMLFSNTAAFLHGWAAEVYLPVGAAQPRQKGLQGLKADRFGRLLRKIVQADCIHSKLADCFSKSLQNLAPVRAAKMWQKCLQIDCAAENKKGSCGSLLVMVLTLGEHQQYHHATLKQAPSTYSFHRDAGVSYPHLPCLFQKEAQAAD
eukprot:1136490-Pelagomonas_calceolata.AAC.1